jgi:hypothetical protein
MSCLRKLNQKKKDTLVFRKIEINNSSCEHIPLHPKDYKNFDAIIESSELKGNHGIIC